MITLKSELSVASCICQTLFFQSLILISIPLEGGDNEVDYFFCSAPDTIRKADTEYFPTFQFVCPTYFLFFEGHGGERMAIKLRHSRK